jgi:hypothetical protein
LPRSLRGLATLHALHQAGQWLGQLSAARAAWPLVAMQLAAVALAWVRPRAAMAVVAALGAAQCALTWPRTGNHLFLGVVVSLLLALLDPDVPEERAQLDASLLALPLLALGWSGVHKLAHGLWFRGETLAWLAASRPDVATVMRPFLSDADAAHLGSLRTDVAGSGPFRLGGGWVVVSNAVWVAELAAVALWLPRLRRWAPGLLLAAVWAVQLVAHEWEFALLLSNLLVTRGRWLLGGGVVLLALARLGVLGVPDAFLATVGTR